MKIKCDGIIHAHMRTLRARHPCATCARGSRVRAGAYQIRGMCVPVKIMIDGTSRLNLYKYISRYGICQFLGPPLSKMNSPPLK